MRAFAELAGAELRHVKPHGAMYTMVVDEPELAAGLCAAVADLGVALLMPPQLADAAAAAGIRFVPEGYVDLDYDAAGKLILERVKQARDPAETARAGGRVRARWPRSRASASTATGRTRSSSPWRCAAALEEAGFDVKPL